MVTIRNAFGRFAQAVSWLVGHPLAFGVAVILIVMWGLSGPVYGYSDTWHAFVRKLLDRGACKLELPLDMKSPLRGQPPEEDQTQEMVRALAVILRTNVKAIGLVLRAVEEQVDAFAAEFDGEDVLRPRMRALLEEAKAKLTELHQRVQAYTGRFKLPEPDDETRGLVKRIVDREMSGS